MPRIELWSGDSQEHTAYIEGPKNWIVQFVRVTNTNNKNTIAFDPLILDLVVLGITKTKYNFTNPSEIIVFWFFHIGSNEKMYL